MIYVCSFTLNCRPKRENQSSMLIENSPVRGRFHIVLLVYQIDEVVKFVQFSRVNKCFLIDVIVQKWTN